MKIEFRMTNDEFPVNDEFRIHNHAAASSAAGVRNLSVIRHSSLVIRHSARRAFTLIEIAISMAIIAFALTIIISILPSSMRVQRDVREETLVLSDGNYVLEAIRHGAINADALMDCVDQIRQGTNLVPFSSSANIVQAMTANPNNVVVINGMAVSNVVVIMRSLGGSMVSQELGNKDMALRYQITPEVLPVSPANLSTNLDWANEVARNLYEVRLTFRWPVLPSPALPLAANSSKKVFRTIVSGGVDLNTNSLGYGLFNTAQFQKP